MIVIMVQTCPYDEILANSISCVDCGFKWICTKYEEQLINFLQHSYFVRTVGKRSTLYALHNIHINKLNVISQTLWHWPSNTEFLKEIVVNRGYEYESKR